jgi:hypothetical protein
VLQNRGAPRWKQSSPELDDEYIGSIAPFLSFAYSGAAMLLLVLPALETKSKNDEAQEKA